MDIATLIGIIGGTGLIISSIIMGGSAVIFFNVPGLLVVVGGTAATAFIKFTLADVLGSISVALKAFFVKVESPEDVISEMVNFANVAKKDGMIALESETPSNAFAAKTLQYLADGYEERMVADMLAKDIRLTSQRHITGQNFFKGAGDSAPAFGMIGTLIGLVQMLANMSDPSKIGPAMAVALLTTLYGAIMANLICLPIADKLALRSQQEQEVKKIIMEAALAITQGISPRVLEESLKISLAPKIREKAGEAEA